MSEETVACLAFYSLKKLEPIFIIFGTFYAKGPACFPISPYLWSYTTRKYTNSRVCMLHSFRDA